MDEIETLRISILAAEDQLVAGYAELLGLHMQIFALCDEIQELLHDPLLDT